MLAKIKKIGATVGGFLIIGLYALFQRELKKSAEERLEAEETAREYEKAGSEALVSGLKREQKKSNESIDTDKRDHFS